MVLRHPIYIILVFLATKGFCQHQLVDSLKGQLSITTADDSKRRILVNLAKEYAYTDSLLLNEYLNEAYLINESREGKMLSATQISAMFNGLGEVNKSHLWLHKIPSDYLQVEDSLTVQWHYLLGVAADKAGHVDSAIVIFKDCITKSKQLSLSNKTAESMNYLANILVSQGNYSTALDYYNQALILDEQTGDLKGISSRLNNIGRIYHFKEEYAKSIDYFKRSLEIYNELESRIDKAIALNNIGYSYKMEGEFKEALPYFRESLLLQNSEGRVCFSIYPIYNLGSVFRSLHQNDSAQFYLQTALSKAADCSDSYIEALSQYDLGKLSESNNQFKPAVSHYMSSYEIAKKAKLINETSAAALALATIYEKSENYKSSTEFLKIHKALNDSIFNKRSLQALARAEAEHEYRNEKKDQELAQKVKEINQSNQLEKSKLLLIIALIGIVSLVIIIVIILYNYNKKKKSYNILEALHQEIQVKTEQLQIQSKALESANEEIISINESLEEKVKLRTSEIEMQKTKIIDYMTYNSHEVRGPLARILGLIQVLNSKKPDQAELESIIKNLNEESVELDLKVRQMNRRLEDERK